MDVNKRILVAVEDSEASKRAVTYVAKLIGGRQGFSVRLFHVLAPLSPELLETPGSEDMAEEAKLEKEVQDAQAQWLAVAERAAQPVFAQAKSILSEAGVPSEAIETHISTSITRQEVATDILEAAQAGKCGTIVVGRSSFSRFKELFRHHVADELVRNAQGMTIWVVE